MANPVSSDSDSRCEARPDILPAGGPGRRYLVIVALLGAGLAGVLWWFNPAEARLSLCTFHRMTGLDCPGCGATRATHELLHGRIVAAWRRDALSGAAAAGAGLRGRGRALDALRRPALARPAGPAEMVLDRDRRGRGDLLRGAKLLVWK